MSAAQLVHDRRARETETLRNLCCADELSHFHLPSHDDSDRTKDGASSG